MEARDRDFVAASLLARSSSHLFYLFAHVCTCFTRLFAHFTFSRLFVLLVLVFDLLFIILFHFIVIHTFVSFKPPLGFLFDAPQYVSANLALNCRFHADCHLRQMAPLSKPHNRSALFGWVILLLSAITPVGSVAGAGHRVSSLFFGWCPFGFARDPPT